MNVLLLSLLYICLNYLQGGKPTEDLQPPETAEGAFSHLQVSRYGGETSAAGPSVLQQLTSAFFYALMLSLSLNLCTFVNFKVVFIFINKAVCYILGGNRAFCPDTGLMCWDYTNIEGVHDS